MENQSLDQQVDNRYVTIGEAAKRAEVSKTQLRYWYDKGLTPFAFKGRGNALSYFLTDIPKIEKIKRLMDVEGDVEKVRELLGNQTKETATSPGGQLIAKDDFDAILNMVKEMLNYDELVKKVANDSFQIQLQQQKLEEYEQKLEEARRSQDQWIGRWRMEQKFRQEAIELWNKKPESERMTGLLWWKQENLKDREDFILAYINEQIESMHGQADDKQ